MALRRVQELDTRIRHRVLGALCPCEVEGEIRYYIFHPNPCHMTVNILGLEASATMMLRADTYPLELMSSGFFIVEFSFTGSSFIEQAEINFHIYQIAIFSVSAPI